MYDEANIAMHDGGYFVWHGHSNFVPNHSAKASKKRLLNNNTGDGKSFIRPCYMAGFTRDLPPDSYPGDGTVPTCRSLSLLNVSITLPAGISKKPFAQLHGGPEVPKGGMQTNTKHKKGSAVP